MIKAVYSKRLTSAAQDQNCTMRGPDCTHWNAQTVPCHLNMQRFGKGNRIKASDLAMFYGCVNCHDLYDGRRKIPGVTRLEIDNWALLAVIETHHVMHEQGVLSVQS